MDFDIITLALDLWERLDTFAVTFLGVLNTTFSTFVANLGDSPLVVVLNSLIFIFGLSDVELYEFLIFGGVSIYIAVVLWKFFRDAVS